MATQKWQEFFYSTRKSDFGTVMGTVDQKVGKVVKSYGVKTLFFCSYIISKNCRIVVLKETWFGHRYKIIKS